MERFIENVMGDNGAAVQHVLYVSGLELLLFPFLNDRILVSHILQFCIVFYPNLGSAITHDVTIPCHVFYTNLSLSVFFVFVFVVVFFTILAYVFVCFLLPVFVISLLEWHSVLVKKRTQNSLKSDLSHDHGVKNTEITSYERHLLKYTHRLIQISPAD